MMILPEKTEKWLKEHNMPMDSKDWNIKHKRSLPLIERACLFFGAGYLSYGFSLLERHNNQGIFLVIAGFVLAIISGLLWRKQRHDDKKVS